MPWKSIPLSKLYIGISVKSWSGPCNSRFISVNSSGEMNYRSFPDTSSNLYFHHIKISSKSPPLCTIKIPGSVIHVIVVVYCHAI